MLPGIMKDVNPLQSEKAYFPIVLIFPDNEISLRPVQPSNLQQLNNH